MGANSRTHGIAVRWRGRGARLNSMLLASCILAAVLMGCQNGASPARAPATGAHVEPLAQEADTVPTAEPIELEVTVLSPRITIEKPLLDLGEVGTDTKRTGKFEFTSTGDAPLKILKVHSCCGVLARGIDPGQEFAPGETGVLEFDYVTGSAPQAARKLNINLQTNDPERKIVSFTIQATVVRRVEYSPARLSLFLRQENAGCGAITLRSLDYEPFAITGFRATGNTITLEYDPNTVASEHVLRPEVDMESLERNRRGAISIDLTHPECGNIRIPFDLLPEFTVNPANLMVINLRPEQPVKRELWVLHNYSGEFEVESVSSQKGYIRLLDKTKVGNRYQLQVEITVPERESEHTMAADMLEVKIKDGDTLTIPFRGIYAGG